MTRQRRSAGGVDRLPSGRYRVRAIDPATGMRLSLGRYLRGDQPVTNQAAMDDPATYRMSLIGTLHGSSARVLGMSRRLCSTRQMSMLSSWGT